MTYASEQVRATLNRGPRVDEDFFRVKVIGDGETNWFNVSPEVLERFVRMLEDTQSGFK